MKKIFSFVFPLFFFLSFFILASSPVEAVNLVGQVNQQIGAGAKGAELEQPGDPRLTIAWLIYLALATVGSVFIVLIVFGSYWYITSHGEEERLSKGRNTIRAAVIGLAVIFVSYSITYFILERISKAVVEGGVVPK
ncbi:MAG TPA: hypothetical protein VJB37_00515 [Patescibacteria group bacterium]|nr:hypothetical protein [Patescibacteria group bacterium]